MSTMSTRASLNNEMIGRLEISFPPREVQVRISEILKSFDDRITLLRETNATLEAIAQALFKSWFVDFDPVRAKAEGRARQDGERSGQTRRCRRHPTCPGLERRQEPKRKASRKALYREV